MGQAVCYDQKKREVRRRGDRQGTASVRPSGGKECSTQQEGTTAAGGAGRAEGKR